MADRVSARRGGANAIFFTLHAGIVATISLVRPTTAETVTVARAGVTTMTTRQTVDAFGLILTAVFGLVLAATWFVLLKSYRELNSAKYDVITQMEAQLSDAPFTEEWKIVKARRQGRRFHRYGSLGFMERAVPVAFVGVYLAAIVRFALW